jgi:hypothetical protein
MRFEMERKKSAIHLTESKKWKAERDELAAEVEEMNRVLEEKDGDIMDLEEDQDAGVRYRTKQGQDKTKTTESQK